MWTTLLFQPKPDAIWTNFAVVTEMNTYMKKQTTQNDMHVHRHRSIELQAHAHAERAGMYEVEHRKDRKAK